MEEEYGVKYNPKQNLFSTYKTTDGNKSTYNSDDSDNEQNKTKNY
jgi:hypothetical protein